jgi:hypothetical protein
VVFLVFAVSGVAAVSLWSAQPSQPSRPVTAYIVRFSATGNTRFSPSMTTVVARTPGGLEGSDRISFQVLADHGCKVGDRVSARAVGSRLVVNARLCGEAAHAAR